MAAATRTKTAKRRWRAMVGLLRTCGEMLLVRTVAMIRLLFEFNVHERVDSAISGLACSGDHAAIDSWECLVCTAQQNQGQTVRKNAASGDCMEAYRYKLRTRN